MLFMDARAADVTPLAEGDVAGAIALLRAASPRELRDEIFLREEFLPHLGLNGEIPHEFPEPLYPWCNQGIRSWQYPIQFARYLTWLADKDIRSYVEIGSRHGGTFIIVVEYLRRFSDLYRACSLDLERSPIMDAYAAFTAGVDYRIGSSTSPEFQAFLGSASWDLAFIDGDHSYQGCVTDFASVRQRSKFVALHDIASHACPGVCQMWDEIRRIVPGSRLFEAVDQYKDVRERTNATFLGIGVVDFA